MKEFAYVAGGAAVALLLRKPLLALYRRKTSVVKLTYFDIHGLGEPIRYVLVLAGGACSILESQTSCHASRAISMSTYFFAHLFTSNYFSRLLLLPRSAL